MTGQKRGFSTLGNNRGLLCPFRQVICQEGNCVECQIYADWLKKSGEVHGCVLMSICPYYNGRADMAESYKRQYCRRGYLWCGRYMLYTRLEKEREMRLGINVGLREEV
jgi:hypothetical protein